MDKIKSALEVALERASAIKVEPEKALELEFLPQGKVLAARFISDPGLNIEAELNKIQPEGRTYARRGLEETWLAGLTLPRDEAGLQANRRRMDGLQLLKKDKGALKQALKEMETLFQYYASAMQQAYVNLKEDLAGKVAQAQQRMGRQPGGRGSVEVERLPEFQEEWLRASSQISTQYEALLEEKRRQIRGLN